MTMGLLEILTALLVVVTGIYTFLNYGILRIMREQQNALVRPYVTFDIIPHDPFFEAIITNTGRTPARGVTVSLHPNIEVELLNERRTPNVSSKTIELLAPGRTIDEFFGDFEEIAKQNPALRFSETVSYRDLARRVYSEPFEIDLNYGKIRGLIPKPDIAEELKRLNDNFRDLAQAMLRQ